MRPLLLLLLTMPALPACKKDRAVITIDGVSASVPDDWVPMDEERVEQLREAARSSDPSVEVAMVGRRPPNAKMPWMYVQRTVIRPHLAKPLQAAKVIDGTLNELKGALTESGLELVSSTSSSAPESRETCFVTKSKTTAPVLNHTCMRLWVGQKSKAVHTVSVVCLAMVDEPAECQRVLDSRQLTASNALPLDQDLSPD
ncbi:MAG: hypothetical protein JNJ54_08905 [Myxococcaceae bacterium]|nr:hypothetical protein [Myxococcaceae bacterium]